jgi:ABC-type thiamin/hydroxymethylpyrimidine transport system permease subunit
MISTRKKVVISGIVLLTFGIVFIVWQGFNNDQATKYGTYGDFIGGLLGGLIKTIEPP